MRILIQRVTQAAVVVEGQTVGAIDRGLLALVGIGQGDTVQIVQQLIDKTLGLRIFADDQGKMNLSLADVGGQLLLVSQFTLYADCKRGRRPAFTASAEPGLARTLFDHSVQWARRSGLSVQTGVFAADMKVSLVNDGPVTILLDSAELL